ncbi:putative beta-glucosidase [Aspergillus fumigatus]
MYLIPKALFIATVLGARTNHHNNPVESGKMLASLTEKASIVTGTVGFGELCLYDGPQGLHFADLRSVFPSELAAAAPWDRCYLDGDGERWEPSFVAKSLSRFPWAQPIGFFPDPSLRRCHAGVYSQRAGCWYAGLCQTLYLATNNKPISQADVFLRKFSLLKKNMRDELDFQGYVMSDFFATHSGLFAINAGLDLNMPGYLSEAAFNHSYFQCGFLVFVMELFLNGAGRDVRGNHSLLIRKIGSAGTVLLKNKDKTLPIRPAWVIGVFGNDAPDINGDPSPGWNCWQSLEADWNLILVVNNVASICRRTVIITHSDGVNIMSWQIMRTSLLFSQRITLGKSLEIPSPTTQP